MNRRERKKEETRSSIIDNAMPLFKEKGFHQTSMEEIAEKSDVSKGTLYNYFPDKESILVGYFQSTIVNYGIEIKEATTDCEDLKTKLYSLLDFNKIIMEKDKELSTVYLRYRMQTLFTRDPFNNPNRSGFEKIMLEIISELQDKREIRSDIPAMIITRTFLLLTVNYFLSNINAKDSIEMDVLKTQLIELFLNGTKL
jgi:AcrR family transcriptional regulator